jgi:signal peptidase II
MKKAGKTRFYLVFCSVAVLVIILDQLVKFFVEKTELAKEIFSIGFFSFTHVHNYGAGFSILQGYNWFFVAVALTFILLVTLFYRKIEKNILPQVGFALMLAGTFSNLVDRISYGFVIDYFDFRIWPVFNIADSAITIGVVLIFIYFLKDFKKNKLKS